MSCLLQLFFLISLAVKGTLNGSDTPQSAALLTIILSLPYLLTILITLSGDSLVFGYTDKPAHAPHSKFSLLFPRYYDRLKYLLKS